MRVLIAMVLTGVLVFIMFWFTLLGGGKDMSLLPVSIVVTIVCMLIAMLDTVGRIANQEAEERG